MHTLVSRIIAAVTMLCVALLWMVSPRGLGRSAAAGFSAPFLVAWRTVRDETALTWRWVASAHEAPARVRELELRLRQTEIQLAETQELRAQVASLRRLVGLKAPHGWRVVVAEVVARDPLTWKRGFRINRGSAHGLALGNAVLAGNTLIGRITECQTRGAAVTTVASQACRVSVVLAGSRETGILWGQGTQSWRGVPRCAIHFLPKEIRASSGELVWTSGIGYEMPGGLVVGRVAGAPGKPEMKIIDATHAEVAVIPLADFDAIRYVVVLCRSDDP